MDSSLAHLRFSDAVTFTLILARPLQRVSQLKWLLTTVALSCCMLMVEYDSNL